MQRQLLSLWVDESNKKLTRTLVVSEPVVSGQKTG
jgi:hypothetical protein